MWDILSSPKKHASFEWERFIWYLKLRHDGFLPRHASFGYAQYTNLRRALKFENFRDTASVTRRFQVQYAVALSDDTRKGISTENKHINYTLLVYQSSVAHFSLWSKYWYNSKRGILSSFATARKTYFGPLITSLSKSNMTPVVQSGKGFAWN